MPSQFYRRYSLHLLLAGLLLLPFLAYEGERVPANNNIETWLPQDSPILADYEWFKDQFGAEEVILIGLPRQIADDRLIEALAARIQQVPGIRQVWTPQRFAVVMTDLGVPPDAVAARLTGLTLSQDQQLVGLVALLSAAGLADRVQVAADVREVLAYCRLSEQDVLLTGAPIVVAELNRLGGIEQSRTFFCITLLISLVLLYSATRNWKISGAVLLITLFAIELTQCSIKWSGGEMNFILAALPVMVMVFTLSISVHVLHYYQSLLDEPDPLPLMLARAWKPVVLASLTTVIGLASLAFSSIGPVRQFGIAGATGAIAAMLAGLGFTPALLVLWPDAIRPKHDHREDLVSRWAHFIIRQKRPITAVSLLTVGVASVGMVWLQPRIDPLDFLPQNSPVVADLLECERELTKTESIEIVVDFGTEDISFVQKLNRVREIEARVASHPAVEHTMSLGSFFPPELPSRALEAARIFSRAQASDHRGDYLSAGERYWRISARVAGDTPKHKERAFLELSEMLQDEPVRLTGIAPLLGAAQHQIFRGFWESFASAFLIIGLVMACSVRSPVLAALAMVPNLGPILLVFGILGWIGMSIDIGMMMTASIALGIAVDGTFHFLVIFKQQRKLKYHSERAAYQALLSTGLPIMQSAVIAACGMLALTASSFSPTIRFGWLMAILLLVAVVGDLVFLPALLAQLSPSPPPAQQGQQSSAAQHEASSRAA